MTLEQRIYRALRRHMMPYRIWPDPKPDIYAAIRRAIKRHKALHGKDTSK